MREARWSGNGRRWLVGGLVALVLLSTLGVLTVEIVPRGSAQLPPDYVPTATPMPSPTPSPTGTASTATPTPSPESTLPPSPAVADTWNGIHLAQIFDHDISDPAAVASRYDFVWGVEQGNLSTFRAGNPNIFLTYYIPFHRDYGTFADSSAQHDIAWWQANHPDWVLYQCDGVTPAYEFGDKDMPLDFTNPAVLAWQVQTYAEPASAAGYDGLAADNVDMRNQGKACGVYVKGKWVRQYTGALDDPQWRAGVLSWLTRMHVALHQLPQPLALVPNLSLSGVALNDPIVGQIIENVDGVLDESGFTQYGNGYLTGDAWTQTIQLIQSVQQQGKPYYIVNQFPTIDNAAVEWAVSCYLMGKEHASAVAVTLEQGYGTAMWHAGLDARIGTPTGDMYATQGVYARPYSGGLSLVNPSASTSYTYTLNAGQSYTNLFGHSVASRITLAPHSGIVLLTT